MVTRNRKRSRQEKLIATGRAISQRPGGGYQVIIPKAAENALGLKGPAHADIWLDEKDKAIIIQVVAED